MDQSNKRIVKKVVLGTIVPLTFLALLLYYHSAIASTPEYGTVQVDYADKMPPPPPPVREIVVNRSNYTLTLYEDGQLISHRKVIVGKPGRSTPLTETKFTHIEVNPYWDVPRSLTDDMVRKFKGKKDRLTYISRNGYHFYDKVDGSEIAASSIDWKNISGKGPYDFIIKQDPGPYNMLGRVMFVLQGTGGVQMHGTANPELFEKDVRRFSSGCIRVDNADNLAAILMDKTDEDYQAMVSKMGNKWIKLKAPVTVRVVE